MVFILLASVGSFLWASEMHVLGSRQQLGAALLSGAVVSLVILVLQVEPAVEAKAAAPATREEHVAQTRDLRWFDASSLNAPGSFLPHRDFRGALLVDADLSDADLSDSLLGSANLTNASLCGASLIWSDLTGANLTGTNLRNADLRGAILVEVEISEDFDYSLLEGALVDKYTRWPGVVDTRDLAPELKMASPLPRQTDSPRPDRRSRPNG